MQKVFLSDVLKAIKKAYIWNDEISQQILERAMMQLPPADDVPERCEDCVNLNKTRLVIPQPEQKTGKWIWTDGVRCSACNHKLQSTGLPSYCPECGARMKGDQ